MIIDMTTSSDDFIAAILSNQPKQLGANLGQEEMLTTLVEQIKNLSNETTKVVSFIGGAGSGKSTLSKLLIEHLEQAGASADSISTDDFNKGDRAWRWENFEDKPGVDPIGKYDFELLNKKVKAIRQNTDLDKTITVPMYTQATGLAIDAGEENYTHRIGKLDVLIVEGDFHPVNNPDLVVYLHVPDAQRLQNRVDRDVVHRGGDHEKTTASFNFRHQVQHLPHTLPVAKEADILLDVKPDKAGWQYDVYRLGKLL